MYAHSHQMRQSQRGFTLIELLIVVTLSVMLLLTASTLFITLLIGNTKTNSLSLIKTEGTAAIAQMEFLLRNALELQQNADGQTCQPSMTSVVVKGFDGGLYTLTALEDPPGSGTYKVASTSATATTYLTTAAVELIQNGPNPDDRVMFNCSQSGAGGTAVDVSFTLRKGIPGIDQAKDIVEQTFTTTTRLRNR